MVTEATPPSVDKWDEGSKASAYDQIITKSAQVDEARARYDKVKDLSLKAKKGMDVCQRELSEMIRAFAQGDEDPGLFESEEE